MLNWRAVTGDIPHISPIVAKTRIGANWRLESCRKDRKPRGCMGCGAYKASVGKPPAPGRPERGPGADAETHRGNAGGKPTISGQSRFSTPAAAHAGGDSSPFVKAKRAIKRGSYSQWTWRDFTRGKTRVIPKMALEAPPRFPWRSACCQAPAVRGGAAPSPEPPIPQPSKRFARREGSAGSQGESQGRLPTSCQASQKTVPGEGQAADCFTACSGSKSVPLANMAQATASSRAATDRKARAWLWPFSRSASYLARQIRSCCTATLLQ